MTDSIMQAAEFPGFEILEKVQESSTTFLWRAKQYSLDRVVMLKILRPEAVAKPSELNRFLQVARLLSRLKADGLAQIFDVVSDDDHHYIVMEAVDGQTLKDMVMDKGALSVSQAARIAYTIAETLGQTWENCGLVHRNLKPTGIRLDGRGVAKIVDFGQALVVNAGQDYDDPDEGLVVGTPNFLSPEQCSGQKIIDHRADMYALGMVLYYLLTGHIPFSELPAEAVVQMQVYGQLPPPRRFRAELPAPICGLIERLTMKHPDDRYQTWTEVMGDIQQIIKGLPLRRREGTPIGTATLAPDAPAQTAANGGKGRRATMPPPSTGNAPVNGGKAVAIPPSVPLKPPTKPALSPFMRVILWVLLFFWFAILANDRLGDPLKMGINLNHIYAASRTTLQNAWQKCVAFFGKSGQTDTAPEVPVERRVQKPVTPAASRPSASEQQVAPAVIREPAVEAPRPVINDVAAGQTSLGAELTSRLVMPLSRGDLVAAREMLQRMPDSKAVSEALTLLQQAPDLDALAEEGIMRMRGQETYIEFKNVRRHVIPQKIANGRISVLNVADKRVVEFDTRLLSPQERLRWAGNLDTPAKQVAACAMMLKANETAFVARNAGACGILAEAFEQAANR